MNKLAYLFLCISLFFSFNNNNNKYKMMHKHIPNMGFYEETPDDTTCPDYSSVCQDPICWKDIEKKYRQSKYSKYQEFLEDVKKMVYNCIKYAIEGTEFRPLYQRRAETALEIIKSAELLSRQQIIGEEMTLKEILPFQTTSLDELMTIFGNCFDVIVICILIII